MKTIFAAAAILAAFITGASATDIEKRSSFDWSGVYAGVVGGYGQANWSGTPEYDDGTGVVEGLFKEGDINAQGWLAGVTIGGQKQLGALVLGIEGDFAYARITGDEDFSAQGAAAGYSWKIEQELETLGTLRARIGYANGDLLIFGTGGVAFGQVSSSETVSADHRQGFTPTAVTAEASADESHIGWVAGAGIEWRFAPGWSFKTEYLHIDLGEAGYKFSGKAYPDKPACTGPISSSCSFPHTTDSFGSALEIDMVRAGVNYRF